MGKGARSLDGQMSSWGKAREVWMPNLESLGNKDNHQTDDGHDEGPLELTEDEARGHQNTNHGRRVMSGKGGSNRRRNTAANAWRQET